MSFDPPRDVNPFEAPRAGIGERAMGAGFLESESDSEAEVIRRAHLSHEVSVKSIGFLNYVGAFFGLLGTVGLLAMGLGLIPMGRPNANPDAPSPEAMKAVFLGLSVVYLALTILNGAMGYGLRRLQTWARWTTVVFTVLGLFYTLGVSALAALQNPVAGLISLLVGSLIPGYFLYLMVSPKAGVVFSPGYKEIIRKTPHVKYKISLIVKLFLGLLLFVIAFGIIAAIFNQFQAR